MSQIDDHPVGLAPAEQNSAYGSAYPRRQTVNIVLVSETFKVVVVGGVLSLDDSLVDDKPYPETWEKVAELRVFRATQGEWAKLISWRGDMKKKGWKLLKVTTEVDSMVAVFGRTREDLVAKSG